MSYATKGDTTKQRILDCAAALFADKGYTETSIRELATAAGLKNPASLYHHFPSKIAILEHMLEDYSAGNINLYDEQIINSTLMKNPTIEGIRACLQTSFPPERAMYYLRVLCVMLQEQLRNPIVRDYMCSNIILRAEFKVRTIIEALIRLGVLRPDTDHDYWMKVVSSLSYSFATRMMLGIGDMSDDFTGMGMADLLKETFSLMLDRCGVAGPGSEGQAESGG